ncbi:AbrB family transcriptional regulator [Nocardioides panacisoli]|nr:AbrB family transcriptional regulator [Nocardioides panacisoli]
MALTTVPALDAPAVPGWLQALGFLLLGGQVGLRFTRPTLAAIGRMMPTVLVVIVLSVAACAGVGVVLAAVTGESRLDAYLATTPGGLPAVLAAATGTSDNLTFVTAAQTVRLLLVLLLTPIVARWVFRRS